MFSRLIQTLRFTSHTKHQTHPNLTLNLLTGTINRHLKPTNRTRPMNLQPLFQTPTMILMLTWHLTHHITNLQLLQTYHTLTPQTFNLVRTFDLSGR
ncbi:hypothetical protein Hanom_Chr08g00687841 [Helianthus anomalus]